MLSVMRKLEDRVCVIEENKVRMGVIRQYYTNLAILILEDFVGTKVATKQANKLLFKIGGYRYKTLENFECSFFYKLRDLNLYNVELYQHISKMFVICRDVSVLFNSPLEEMAYVQKTISFEQTNIIYALKALQELCSLASLYESDRLESRREYADTFALFIRKVGAHYFMELRKPPDTNNKQSVTININLNSETGA